MEVFRFGDFVGDDAVDFGENDLMRNCMLAEQGQHLLVCVFESMERIYEDVCSSQSSVIWQLNLLVKSHAYGN